MKYRKYKKHYFLFLTVFIMIFLLHAGRVSCEASTSVTKEKASIAKKKVTGVMATAVKRKIAVTWEPVKGAYQYAVYEAYTDTENKSKTSGLKFKKVKTTTKTKCILKNRKKGITYTYYIVAYDKKNYNSKKSKRVSTTVAQKGTSTIKNFLQTAIAPVGSTMYIWGGGWNKEDTGAGKEARTIGLSAAWRTFFKEQTSSYNYQNHWYEIHNGLDCSGFVGWCIYNIKNTANNKKGYVYKAAKEAETYAALGFGSYTPAYKIKNYKAGDIMSSRGHVWIVIGQCKDKSVVLVHSSPNGVQINGTTTPSGSTNSEAAKLAKKYMEKYYPKWYNRYGSVCKGSDYLQNYGQMRFRTNGSNILLSDPENYQDKTAKEILKDLFKGGK